MGSRGEAAAALALLLMVMVGTSSLVDAACSNNMSGLSTCYDAVKKGGSTPTPTCCGTVKSWGLSCLCSVLSKFSGQLPPTIDMKEIVALPKKCGVPVPKGYKCAGTDYAEAEDQVVDDSRQKPASDAAISYSHG